ncbi:uncharacterized protein FIESC28_11302 [Fusarium coffeatum]|uniref:2EXR domain-containing protein n=1 Tax=Fusarium coffeatum TaxID=231269 RepID=A0A366QLT3_9HYPO|nr:uncharacterized protein FIESC28_11302 [Fusarium coffeatum]RBR05787.1 hypothetical protein FIESC28_11302 [Fusarium coffeatum]
MDNIPPRRNVRTENLSPPCPNKRIMFLERADSPLRQANASEQRLGASQQQDDELGSFHRFSQLPPELQDQIWKHALDISAPTAHYAHPKLESDGYCKMRLLKIKRKCSSCYPRRERPSIEAIYPVRQALMQTCRRSYAFVKDIWERESPGTALLEIHEVYEDISECYCPRPSAWHGTLDESALGAPYFVRTYGGGPAMPLKPPTKRIDISQDLMILRHSVSITFGHGRIPSDFKRGTGTNIKQIAVPFSLELFWRYRSSLACMLGVLKELRTLYLLIEPRQDCIQPRIIEGRLVEAPSRTNNLHLREALHGHRRTPEDTSPETFYLRGRIYYELPDEEVLYNTFPNEVLISFHPIEEIAKEQRQKNGGVPLPPLVIRFMSWKLAPGVRGRFETDPELL